MYPIIKYTSGTLVIENLVEMNKFLKEFYLTKTGLRWNKKTQIVV